MLRTSRWLAVVAGFVISILGATLAPAHADVVHQNRWFVTGTAAIADANGSWHLCATAQASPNPSSITCGQTSGYTQTFSATVTGTAKVGDSSLSAAVGYNVTQSYTKSVSYTVSVPKNTTVNVYWATRWYRHKVTQQECTVIVQTGRCTGSYFATAYAYTHKYHAIVWKNTSS